MVDSYNFSKRTDWTFSPNELTQTLESLRQQGITVLDLTQSNPTRAGLEYPRESILQPLAQPRDLSYDPDPRGILRAREAVREYYRQKGFEVPVEHIFLTASTSEGYSYLLRLLVNPGEKVLLPRPSYPLFQYLVDVNDAQAHHYPLKYDKRWQVCFDSLEGAMDQDVKAIMMVNPNNPTGSFIRRDDARRFNVVCQKYSSAIISDEVFWDYAFDNDHEYFSLIQNKEALTFVLGGISKALGLPQMKLSWIVINGPTSLVQEATKRLEMIADTYLSVNTPVQNALGDWLSLKDDIQGEIKGRILENYDFIKQHMEHSTRGRLLNTEGGWYAILNIPDWQTEEEWILQFLKDDHVLVHPGYFFDFEQEAYLVLSLLPPPSDFQEGVKRILNRIQHEMS